MNITSVILLSIFGGMALAAYLIKWLIIYVCKKFAKSITPSLTPEQAERIIKKDKSKH